MLASADGPRAGGSPGPLTRPPSPVPTPRRREPGCGRARSRPVTQGEKGEQTHASKAQAHYTRLVLRSRENHLARFPSQIKVPTDLESTFEAVKIN